MADDGDRDVPCPPTYRPAFQATGRKHPEPVPGPAFPKWRCASSPGMNNPRHPLIATSGILSLPPEQDGNSTPNSGATLAPEAGDC